MEKYGARSEWKSLEQGLNGKFWNKSEWKSLEQGENGNVRSNMRMGMCKVRGEICIHEGRQKWNV